MAEKAAGAKLAKLIVLAESMWAILKVVRTVFAAEGGEGLAKNSEPKS